MSGYKLPSLRARLLLSSEIGTVKKKASKLRVALIYPNTYWVGMSNLGFHTIYYELNRREDTGCERVFFSPEARKAPLSLESGSSISEFDILAISCSFELDYLNVLQMLHLAKIPLKWKERTKGFPLIIAGGCFTFFNLRPLIKFVDCFLVGEAEESIHEVMDTISHRPKATNYQKKRKLLEELAKIEGVYVPGVSKEARLRRIDVNKYDTTSRILTPYTEFSNMYLIELSRGCNRGCKFCVSGHVYGRLRTRSLRRVLDCANVGLKYTKRIGLVAAAVSDYPEIDELCGRLQAMGARISVSSLRPDSLTPTLIESLVRSGERTMTIAPEAGTEMLRCSLNKRITDPQILDAIRKARDLGMRKVKLYFMIGLPTESEEDIIGLIDLIKMVAQILPVKASITPFIPKPRTPLGDEEIEDKRELKAKLQQIRDELRSYPKVSIISEGLNRSLLQARLAKGDEGVLDSFISRE